MVSIIFLVLMLQRYAIFLNAQDGKSLFLHGKTPNEMKNSEDTTCGGRMEHEIDTASSAKVHAVHEVLRLWLASAIHYIYVYDGASIYIVTL